MRLFESLISNFLCKIESRDMETKINKPVDSKLSTLSDPIAQSNNPNCFQLSAIRIKRRGHQNGLAPRQRFILSHTGRRGEWDYFSNVENRRQ